MPDRELGQIPTDMLNPSTVAYSEGYRSTNNLRNSLDWLFNVALAYLLFMVTWPLMLITALLIKLEDGWRTPVLYNQVRVGVKGKHFNTQGNDVFIYWDLDATPNQNGNRWRNATNPSVRV